jgi:signal transduction histidine kinase
VEAHFTGRIQFAKIALMKRNMLQVLYISAMQFLEPLGPVQTYTVIIREAKKLVAFDEGVIYVEQKGRLQNVYSSNPKDKSTPQKKGAYLAFAKKKVITLSKQEVASLHPGLYSQGIISMLFIPLMYKNKAIGVLSLRSSSQQEIYTKDDIAVLHIFSSLVSLAIRKMQLNYESKRALSMRDQFISLAAHELRTPLTSIHGYLQLLEKKIPQTDTTKTKWVKEMAKETMKLRSLVTSLLEVHSIERGKQLYSFSHVSIAVIVKKAIEYTTLLYPQHQIVFENTLGEDVSIIADEQKLEQAVTSILDNAAKFSNTEDILRISLAKPKNKKKYIQLIISDQGKGIREFDLPNIFEGFYKGDNNQSAGMGLGLLLAKHIIEKHHGSISLTSKQGRGTSVTILLPIA